MDLMHYGVIGMKWGVRKDRKTGSSGRKKQTSDHREMVALKKKGMKKLSNDELKKVIARMDLEKRYKNLSKRDLTAGEKFVRNVLLTVGTTYSIKVVGGVVERYAGDFIKDLGKRN